MDHSNSTRMLRYFDNYVAVNLIDYY